eukprot:9936168-Alexandrium_andersonii.AAC.1
MSVRVWYIDRAPGRAVAPGSSATSSAPAPPQHVLLPSPRSCATTAGAANRKRRGTTRRLTGGTK